MIQLIPQFQYLTGFSFTEPVGFQISDHTMASDKLAPGDTGMAYRATEKQPEVGSGEIGWGEEKGLGGAREAGERCDGDGREIRH